MEQSATPLLVLMIAVIVTLALTVHAVSAGDPLYGSNLKILDAAPEPVQQDVETRS